MPEQPQDSEQEQQSLEDRAEERLPLWRGRTARQEAAALLLIVLIAAAGWFFFRKAI